jgi:hypothetical protein
MQYRKMLWRWRNGEEMKSAMAEETIFRWRKSKWRFMAAGKRAISAAGNGSSGKAQSKSAMKWRKLSKAMYQSMEESGERRK